MVRWQTWKTVSAWLVLLLYLVAGTEAGVGAVHRTSELVGLVPTAGVELETVQRAYLLREGERYWR